MKVSTGMRNHILTTGDVESGVNGGEIRLYGSPTSTAAALALIPATADAAIGSATLLCTITVNGTGGGLNMATTPDGGVLSKSSSEVWMGTMVASGYFSFARFCSQVDDGTLSTTAKRLQLSVGTLSSEIVVSSAYKPISEEQRIDQFYIGVPAE